jgi:hypothetical protein
MIFLQRFKYFNCLIKPLKEALYPMAAKKAAKKPAKKK